MFSGGIEKKQSHGISSLNGIWYIILAAGSHQFLVNVNIFKVGDHHLNLTEINL